MVYFSYYQEYPIYEAAEGGYYYSGNELVMSKAVSKRKAKKLMEKYKRELIDDVIGRGEKPEWMESKSFKEGHSLIMEPGFELYKRGHYKGEGESYVIETKKGIHERGQIPFC